MPQDAPDPATAGPALEQAWTALRAELEWLCHAGLGRLFAPWDAATTREYAAYAGALEARVRAMARAGVLRPERVCAMAAAVAAHGADYDRRDELAQLRARDDALREAFAPPEALRAAVLAAVPATRWPLSRFLAPPPQP